MDFTTTLADSLLDDLDDLSDTEEQEVQSEDDDDKAQTGAGDDAHVNEEGRLENGQSSSVQKRKNDFVNDPKLQAHLAAIAVAKASVDKQEEGYSLMTTSNKYLLSIQSVISKAHSDLVMAYKSKFPELEDLLPDPLAYKNAIKVIQNEMDLTMINEQLNSVAKLSSNQIITLSVASSTTSGQPLTQSQLDRVNQCIEYIDQVLDIKERLIAHVEQHMEHLAPNMVVLTGPTLAARLVSTAGGMSELCRIPACNLQVLGQQKATSASRAGMGTSIAASSSTAAASGNIFKPHEGILSQCELYNMVPSNLQRKALKVIAAKLALAIRCDYVNLESGRARTKTSGLKFRSEIEAKFVKWEEPDQARVVKALPK
jgi:U4/U6 small nuclear ribonucleoprotein PRP31